MKKIKIFIGSSIDELKDVRNSLARFFVGLNNKYISKGVFIEAYFCEEISGEMHPEGSQKQHDDYIEKEADATFFMFCEKAGPYTVHELKIAKNSLDTTKKPNIFVFFKMIDNDVANNADIAKVIELVTKEYGHYYKKFDNEDTIKLEILEYFVDLLEDESEITVLDGAICVNNQRIEDISIENIFAFQQNAELKHLKKEINELTDKIQYCIQNNMPDDIDALTKSLKLKQKLLENLELDILKILKHLYREMHGEKADPIKVQALSLMEHGKIEEALNLIPIENVKNKIDIAKANLEIANENLELAKNEANSKIETALTRIEALKLATYDDMRFRKIIETFETAYELALSIQNIEFMYEYSKFCLHMAKENGEKYEDSNLYLDSENRFLSKACDILYDLLFKHCNKQISITNANIHKLFDLGDEIVGQAYEMLWHIYDSRETYGYEPGWKITNVYDELNNMIKNLKK